MNNGVQSYGWGIRFLITDSSANIRDIKVTDCEIENVSHTGLQFHGPHNGLRNIEVQNVTVAHTGGPGVQMGGVTDGHFSQLDVNGSGSTNDTRNWKRGSGLWTWDSDNVVIEKSRFQNANGEPSSIIRSGDWKLIHYWEDGHNELYNLVADIGEQHDLATVETKLAADLWSQLQRWLKSTGAKIPQPNPDYKPAWAEQQHKAALKQKENLEKQHAEFLNPN